MSLRPRAYRRPPVPIGDAHGLRLVCCDPVRGLKPQRVLPRAVRTRSSGVSPPSVALGSPPLCRGASPGLKRGGLEVVKYASRPEIYCARQIQGPKMVSWNRESRNRVLWRMRGDISTQPSNISERVMASKSVLKRLKERLKERLISCALRAPQPNLFFLHANAKSTTKNQKNTKKATTRTSLAEMNVSRRPKKT